MLVINRWGYRRKLCCSLVGVLVWGGSLKLPAGLQVVGVGLYCIRDPYRGNFS